MRRVFFGAIVAVAAAVGVVAGIGLGAFYHVAAPNSLAMANAASEPDQGKQLYHCGMHPWIVQDHPGHCPICHMELTPFNPVGAASETLAPRKIRYYWDPMLGASSISQKPGKSAMGMELVPVYSDEVSAGPTVTIDPTVVQNMGVQTAAVTKGALHKSLRTVGYLEVPETGLHDITMKVRGYVDKLYADKAGMRVGKGDALFDFYSPDLIVAEEELIAARKSRDAMKASGAGAEVMQQAAELFASARRKLQLWDIPDSEIDAIARRDEAQKDIVIRSPAEGYLEDKMIVQGAAVQAGMKLMRIEDQRSLWLEAQVYEEQLPLVALGETVDATLDSAPGKVFTGKIIFISPKLNRVSRTTDVRVVLENAGSALKPGMYATVRIHARPIEDAVLVPGTAIIDTGTRKIVFVQEGGGHFSARLVTTGLTGDNDQTQVLSGVVPGETVVTSGQFLLDVESRTLEAVEKMMAPDSGGATTQAAIDSE